MNAKIATDSSETDIIRDHIINLKITKCNHPGTEVAQDDKYFFINSEGIHTIELNTNLIYAYAGNKCNQP